MSPALGRWAGEIEEAVRGQKGCGLRMPEAGYALRCLVLGLWAEKGRGKGEGRAWFGIFLDPQ